MISRIINLCLAPLLSFLLYIFLPSDYFSVEHKEALSLTFLMVYWWIAEPIPIPYTALLPLILGVPIGLISLPEAFGKYTHHLIFLFLGGFILAKGLEKHQLHILISRKIISLFGNSANRILLGFMMATAFLSMWISNTATVLMLLPMALSVLKSIPKFEHKEKYSIALLLSIAFAANVGGTATIVGTPPNSLLIGNLQDLYDIQIGFFEWMIIGIPFAMVMLLVIYAVLYLIFLRKINFTTITEKASPLTKNQKRVLVIFGCIILLWVSRQVLVDLIGWKIKDAYIAMLGAILLFVIPQEKKRINLLHISWILFSLVFLYLLSRVEHLTLFNYSFELIELATVLTGVLFLIPSFNSKALLKARDIKTISWGILVLFGGGMALAQILDNTGLVALVISEVSELSNLGLIGIFVLIVSFALFATELMSNMALVTVLIPLVGQFAIQNNYPLIQLTASVALAASCAFMLPIATPPNAIVFSSGKIRIATMMKVGVFINIAAIAVIIFMVRIFL